MTVVPLPDAVLCEVVPEDPAGSEREVLEGEPLAPGMPSPRTRR